MSLKYIIDSEVMSFYIRNSYKFMSFIYVIIIFKIIIDTTGEQFFTF